MRIANKQKTRKSHSVEPLFTPHTSFIISADHGSGLLLVLNALLRLLRDGPAAGPYRWATCCFGACLGAVRLQLHDQQLN